MLRLTRRESAVLTLSEGVAVTVRPAGLADFQLSYSQVRRAAADAANGAAALARLGVAAADQISEDDITPGSVLVAIDLAIKHVTAWDGIGDDAGNPLPLSPEGLVLLMNAPMPGGGYYGAAFLQKLTSLSPLADGAEKNASTASPGGAGAAVTTGAAPAAPSAPLAPAAAPAS